jgi:exopolysaccharide biosynthesis polyprenyl glycosylphosphotransferase
MVLDGALVMLSLRIAILIRPELSSLSQSIADLPYPAEIPAYIYISIAFIWVLVFLLNNQYDPGKNLLVVDEMNGVVISSILASVMIAGMLYLTFRETSRVLFLTSALFSTIFTGGHRLIYRIGFRLSKVKLVSHRRILIVGAGPVGLRVADTIHQFRGLGYDIAGFADDNVELSNTREDVLGTIDQIQEMIVKHNINNIVVALPGYAYYRINELVDQLHSFPVRVWLIPDYFALTLTQAKVVDFAGLPLIDLRAPVLSYFQRLIKRLFDLIITIPAMIVSFPFFLTIILLIYLDSPGPIFYVSKRIKENGEIFGMLKFRTMVVDADKQLQQVMKNDENGNMIHKLPDDPRVTRFGRFLRKTSMDELPQLFNILVGDMSWVGPRPELPEMVDLYEPWQRKRFTVPQGLTGWWQVNGRSDKPMHLFTEDDLYYIQHYSLWLDLQILIKTVWVVIRGKGAY